MAQTVRIDEPTHALLRELADADGVTLHEELGRAVRARKRERFFAELTAGFAALSSEERDEDACETAVWDVTSADGLADE
jgi:hypothetical protein